MTACSSSDDGSRKPAAAPSAVPSVTPQPAPPESVEPSCPNQQAVAADVSLETAGRLHGDVDGDGSPEEVAIYFDPVGEPGCQAFVLAGDAAGVLETWTSDFGLPMPTLNSLVDLDGEPGDEIVVNMGVGASTQFVGVVAFEDGALRQVTLEGGAGMGPEGMFGFGGSVGHVEAVDCARGGVVASFAAPSGRAYLVERRFFEFDGAELVPERVEKERLALEELDRLPEYAQSPFGSCSR